MTCQYTEIVAAWAAKVWGPAPRASSLPWKSASATAIFSGVIVVEQRILSKCSVIMHVAEMRYAHFPPGVRLALTAPGAGYGDATTLVASAMRAAAKEPNNIFQTK